MKYKGDWSSDLSYVEGDIVRYPYDKERTASWYAAIPSKGTAPSCDDGTTWGVLSIDGRDGKAGSTGTPGPQGPQGATGFKGLQGPRGFPGIPGMTYVGEYDINSSYTYQQAVSMLGKVYVASNVILKGTPPPDGDWIEYPGFSESASISESTVNVEIVTSDDFSSGSVSGKNSYTVRVETHSITCGNGGFTVISGSYIKSFTGSIKVKVPDKWTVEELSVVASGTATVSANLEGWLITSSVNEPVAVVFYGVRSLR